MKVSGHVIQWEHREGAMWRLHCNGFTVISWLDGMHLKYTTPTGLCELCARKQV